MKQGILGCESFGQEEFYIRRLHSLITDFLALMPMKVRDAADVHHQHFDLCGLHVVVLSCQVVVLHVEYIVS